jgi:hypothetical protein
MFVGQARSLLGAPLKGRLLALATDIRLDWEYLPREKTLAYLEHS